MSRAQTCKKKLDRYILLLWSKIFLGVPNRSPKVMYRGIFVKIYIFVLMVKKLVFGQKFLEIKKKKEIFSGKKFINIITKHL